MAKRLRLGVLLSGGGTTLENLLRRVDEGTLDAEVATVLASRPGIRGIEVAETAGVPCRILARRDFASTEAFSEAITAALDEAEVGLVCLAGFLSFWIIPDRYVGRTMNIHPALLPSFGGKGMYGHHVHEAVVAHGCKVSGCTVHFATNDAYDAGPIVLQRPAPVYAEDTPDEVAARVFREECIAYPEAIRLFAEGRLRLEGRRVYVDDPAYRKG